jgi:hypothetical protein
MLEMGTSGLMSGDGKRDDTLSSAPALVLDSTTVSQRNPEAGAERFARMKLKLTRVLLLSLLALRAAVQIVVRLIWYHRCGRQSAQGVRVRCLSSEAPPSACVVRRPSPPEIGDQSNENNDFTKPGDTVRLIYLTEYWRA